MKQNKIQIIQVIRLAAALGVLVYHSGIAGEHGYFGVEIFNMISGYIILYSTCRPESEQCFMRRRLIRILPLYWGLTLFFYGLILWKPELSVMSEARPEYLIKSLLFVPFVNGRGYDAPILGLGWTLNYEMFFYLIFWAAMHISHRRRGLLAAAMIGIFVAAGRLFAFPVFSLNYYSSLYMLEFVLGMGSYYVVEMLRKRRTPGLLVLCGLLAAASLLWLVPDLGAVGIHRCFRLGIPAWILVVSLLVLFEDTGMPAPLVSLGNATFSIYLIEYFTTAAYKLAAVRIAPVLRWPLLAAVAAVTLLCARVSYRLVEVRLTEYLKRRLIPQDRPRRQERNGIYGI